MTPLAIIRSHDGYRGLQQALRARWKALGIAGETLDDLSGLTARYAGKLLAPRPPKHLGSTSLGPVMGALGCMLLLVEDEEMMRAIVGRLGDRRHAPANMRPRKRRSHWKGSKEWGAVMACHRALKTTPRQRSILARKAANARWKNAKKP